MIKKIKKCPKCDIIYEIMSSEKEHSGCPFCEDKKDKQESIWLQIKKFITRKE